MSLVTGYQIGERLCKAFGLEGQSVTALDLHVHVNEVVTLTIERFADSGEIEKLVKVFEPLKCIDQPEPAKEDSRA